MVRKLQPFKSVVVVSVRRAILFKFPGDGGKGSVKKASGRLSAATAAPTTIDVPYNFLSSPPSVTFVRHV